MRHPYSIAKAAFVVSLLVLSSGCREMGRFAREPEPDRYVPSIVTGDIKAGIEKHIADKTEQGGGYFTVPFEGGELRLKLVRVHVEYLASLAPQRHFACVDMASDDGQFYDIDFFLHGDPGDMTVTETTVHKLNGKPYYVWKQQPDKTWVRAPVDEATKALLGIITGYDAFEFRYQATVPQLKGQARCWIPIATSDDFQKVQLKSIQAPGKTARLIDTAHSNAVLYLELGPEDSGKQIELVYDVLRLEKGAYPGAPAEAARALQPERRVPVNDNIRAIAQQAVKGRDEDDLMKARALYDYVLDQMKYKKFGEGWGQGDALYACDALYGNCTDYHAYFIALARSIGIPARFAIGAAIPSNRDDGGTDGYHCWAEFYADGKWWPVDISEADKFSALSMYYFGHHPANRFEFSHGRDLMLDPGPASGPINFLAYPVLEVNGVPKKMPTLFLFQRTGCAAQ